MLTLRLGLFQTEPKRAQELADALTRQKGSCDEVWLTTRGFYPPLDFHRNLAQEWMESAEIFRKAGLRVSLQIANTIGHRDWESSAPDKEDYFFRGMRENGELYDRLTDYSGYQNHSCYCWRGERFRQYIACIIRTFAQPLQPHCIFLDDDLRAFSHNPLKYGCFCDNCLAKFNAQYEYAYTRETLTEEINYGDVQVRRQFLDFTMEGIQDFLSCIVKACHEVSPNTHFGLEYGHTQDYPAMNENYIIEALHDASGMEVELRPGGGFYNDKAPFGEYTKALLLAYQITDLPACVSSVKAEIENLPGVAFGKSIGGIINEGTLDLAYGCTGLSFTDVQSCHEPMAYYERIFKRFSEIRPYWERLSHLSSTAYHGGAAVYRSRLSNMRSLQKDEEPFAWTEIAWEADYNWVRLGLPFTFDTRHASVYILHHTNVAALTDADIEFLLEHPVIADAQSVQTLCERGYSDFFDFKLKEIDDPDAAEHFTAHPVNGAFAGNHLQENPYATKPMRRFVLTDLQDTTQVLGIMKTSPFADKHIEYGACTAITRIQRKDGKDVKWGVFGYSIWSDLTSASKRNQTAGALDAIATVPARLLSEEQAALIPAVNADGKTIAVTVSSVSQGGTDEMLLSIRHPISNTVTTYTSRNRIYTPTIHHATDTQTVWKLPPIDPYELVTLFLD